MKFQVMVFDRLATIEEILLNADGVVANPRESTVKES
jgi:hypothetical protein